MPTIEADPGNGDAVSRADRFMPERLHEGGCEAALPLVTDRLILRPPTPEDAGAVVALAGSWAVARQTASIPHPLSEEDALTWFARSNAARHEGTGVALLVTERDTGVIMGAMGLMWGETWPEAELGYWMGERFQRRGFATEAGRAVLALAFETLGLHAVFASARPDNAASTRVMEKLGLRPDGQRVRIEATARGETWDHDRLSLDRAGWAGQRATRSRLVLVVAAALVDRDGRVLLTRRPPGKAMAGLWEFPGGKVHEGETPEDALVRELYEELGLDVRHACLAPLTFASHAYADFHLLMPLFVLRSWSGRLRPREGQETAWVRAARLRDYPMPPADPPLIPALQDLLTG
jgi:8-oxo-dGTP diphosphatase